MYFETGIFNEKVLNMRIFKDDMILPPDLPFKMIYPSLLEKDNCRSSFHWHDFCEISYVKSGVGSYLLNGRKISVGIGDFLIFNRAQLHGWLVEQNKIGQGCMELVVMMFSTSFLNLNEAEIKAWEDCRVNRIDASSVLAEELKKTMNILETECANKEVGYGMVIRSQLLRAIALMLRTKTEEPKTTEQEISGHEGLNAMNRMEKAVKYINEHYAGHITLEEAASVSEMNVNYFSTFFKKTTGMGFQEYLIKYRLERVEEMKRRQGITNSEAATRCGFHNLSNYYRLNKKYMKDRWMEIG